MTTFTYCCWVCQLSTEQPNLIVISNRYNFELPQDPTNQRHGHLAFHRPP